MKYTHTYCFYMNNGEHLMIDADEMIVCDDLRYGMERCLDIINNHISRKEQK